MPALKEAIEAFLFEEADMADRHAYADWLSLWAEDACYWLPCNDDDADPQTHVALIYDNYTGLEDRVRRLQSGHAHTQNPRTRLSRIVGNVRVRALADDLFEVRSVVNITAYRRHEMSTYAGRVVHQLRPHQSTYKIVRKTVYLVNNDGYMNNMTFLI